MPSRSMHLALAAIVALVLGCAGKASASVTSEKIASGALVLDVRTAAEFATGHYEGAHNIPVLELASRLEELGDSSRPIVVYCRSGRRSARAAEILKAADFKDVTDAGGLDDMPPAP